ncbi:MAG: hypothetical protein WD357_05010 [Gracilimonas sp.]
MEDNIIFQILIITGLIWLLKAIIDAINEVYFGAGKNGENLWAEEREQKFRAQEENWKRVNSIEMTEEKRVRDLRNYEWIALKDINNNSNRDKDLFKYILPLPAYDGSLEVYLRLNYWELHFLRKNKEFTKYEIDKKLFVSKDMNEVFNAGEKIFRTIEKNPHLDITSIVNKTI